MEYKLTYFEARGRAEAFRLLFSVAGVKFENNRVSFEEFAEMKPNLPYGELPTLEYNGLVMSQSFAIGRFLAKKFGLYGSNDIECFKIDELCDAMADYFNIYWERWTAEKGADPESVKKFLEVATPKYLTKFNSVVKENGGKFLVGQKMTWADIVLFNLIDYYDKLTGMKLTKNYPTLDKFVKDIRAHPKIQEWIANRPPNDAF